MKPLTVCCPLPLSTTTTITARNKQQYTNTCTKNSIFTITTNTLAISKTSITTATTKTKTTTTTNQNINNHNCYSNNIRLLCNNKCDKCVASSVHMASWALADCVLWRRPPLIEGAAGASCSTDIDPRADQYSLIVPTRWCGEHTSLTVRRRRTSSSSSSSSSARLSSITVLHTYRSILIAIAFLPTTHTLSHTESKACRKSRMNARTEGALADDANRL